MNFSDKANRVKESETIKMSATARKMLSEGKEIINLSLGEPDFDTPESIKNAAINALHEGKTKYPPVSGVAELKKAICVKLNKVNRLSYEPSNIVVSNGAKHSIANIMLAMINPGDEVIIPTPYWVSYDGIVQLLGAVPIFVEGSYQNKFKITPDQLESAITEKTKLMIFSSPCNPTGEVFAQQELDGLAKVLADHPEILVVSDEIYEYINFTDVHASIAHSPGMKERCAIVNGVSKSYAMTGWRLGYMAAPAAMAKKCELIQGQFTSGVNTMTQWAALAALTMDQTPVIQMRDEFRKRKNFLISELQEMEGIKVHDPEGAFYAFPVVSHYFGKKAGDMEINNADDFSQYLLEEGYVATVSGRPFGAPECIRISYAASMDSLKEAMQRMRTVISRIQ